MDSLTLSDKEKQTPLQIREKIARLEDAIKQIDGHLGPDPFPLEHTFAGGMYARKVTHPKGVLIVGKIHKYEHLFFLLEGEISVSTENGVKRIKAPYMTVTPPGTKRAAYAHEDSVVMTVHRIEAQTLDDVEKELIAESFEEVPALTKEV